MSDSGKVMGDCKHGNFPEFCVHCLQDAVDKLKRQSKVPCDACWTSSWAPCEEGEPNAIRDISTGGYMVCRHCVVANAYRKLLAAVTKHHEQKADDRCHFDDDELYAAAGLPPADYRVGDKFAMLSNCIRYVDKRCEDGHWVSYAALVLFIRSYPGTTPGTDLEHWLSWREAILDATKDVSTP